MDQKLVAWARAVKARRRSPTAPPPLWLFTDAARRLDPRPDIARLPPGLCGVVFRHDGVPGRAVLGHAIARLCRARRLVLTVAGDPRLAAALHAGLHLRGGRRPSGPRVRAVTSSAHTMVELIRARRAGAALIFLSPAFPTRSHPAAVPLGPIRWSALAKSASSAAAGLGGITGKTVRRLAKAKAGGAISSVTNR